MIHHQGMSLVLEVFYIDNYSAVPIFHKSSNLVNMRPPLEGGVSGPSWLHGKVFPTWILILISSLISQQESHN